MHGQIERVLEASGLAFTHLRAGEFMPAYFRQVPNILGRGVLALPMEDARIASVDVGDLAEAAALILTSPGHEGKMYPLTGPQALSMNEAALVLSEVAGKSIRYVNVPPEDAKNAQLSAGMAPYMADALAELFAERRRGKESLVHPDLARLLGRPATPFSEFVRRNAAVFRGERPAPRI